MIEFRKIRVDCNLSQAAFEDAIAQLEEFESSPQSIVVLITGIRIAFDAARLVRFYENEIKSHSYLHRDFCPPWIDLVRHHGWGDLRWAILGKDKGIYSPGVM